MHGKSAFSIFATLALLLSVALLGCRRWNQESVQLDTSTPKIGQSPSDYWLRLQENLIEQAKSTSTQPADWYSREADTLLVLLDQSQCIDPALPADIRTLLKLRNQRRYDVVVDAIDRIRSESSERCPAWLEQIRADAMARMQMDSEAAPQWPTEADEASVTVDGWLALARHSIAMGQSHRAVAALIRVVEVDPTDEEAYRLLAVSLRKLGDRRRADAAERTSAWIENTMHLAKRIRDDSHSAFYRQEMSTTLMRLGRPVEAMAWKASALAVGHQSESEVKETVALMVGLAADPQLQSATAEQRRLGLSREEYSIDSSNTSVEHATTIEAGLDRSKSGEKEHPSLEIAMIDVAEQVGLRVSFASAIPPNLREMRLHETIGGGVAVLDYDRDGWQDLSFASGGHLDTPEVRLVNRLIRQVDAVCRDVTIECAMGLGRYSVAMTVADVNADGHQDLVVGNVGDNDLWINQGDGTFHRQIISAPSTWTLTAGIAVADADMDGIDEIFEANYTDDSTMLRALPQNSSLSTSGASPLEYQPGRDRLLRQTAPSVWQEVSSSEFFDDHPGASLAVCAVRPQVSDNDGDLHASLIWHVAADMTANRWWRSSAGTRESTELGPWTDIAAALGIDRGVDGVLGASMSTTVGDFLGDGSFGFHVTNFVGQDDNLWSLRKGTFRDAGAQMNLSAISRDNLGFAGVAADQDNDGDLDLLVMSGHIHDSGSPSEPFRMTPKVWRQHGGRFEAVDPKHQGPNADSYFSQPALGRSAARLDWNRDGRIDFVSTHLDRPAALLINQTRDGSQVDLDAHQNWISIDLVGRQHQGVVNSRDAVGAIVTVQAEGKGIRRWQTSGEGFAGSNQHALHFGLPPSMTDKSSEIDVTVDWLGGGKDEFHGVHRGKHYLAIQGETSLWTEND
jgi:ASPIC and UnbV/FG-GAP-like repeat